MTTAQPLAPESTTESDGSTALATRLEQALDGEVRFDDYSRHIFSRDASIYAIQPVGVVFPKHADDIAATVTIAAEHGVTVTARGGGTSLAGQTTGAGIVVDCSRHMNRILDIDPERRTARVQPGVVQEELNQAAASFGLVFGPDTSTSNRATIGGMIGNNSAGSGSVRYGMTIDHVRSLDVVLADGSRARFEPVDDAERERRSQAQTLEGAIYRGLPEILDSHAASITNDFPPFWRRATGYRLDRLADDTPFDLATFVVRAQGTLAIAAEAAAARVPKPPHPIFAVGPLGPAHPALAATAHAPSCDPAP